MIKKKNNPEFDFTMGSFDGAETSELVGLYLLSKSQRSLTTQTSACTATMDSH